MLQIRAAQEAELTRVQAFYDSLIDAMQDAAFKPGWKKGIYPSPELLRTSLRDGTLYVGEEGGELVAAMVADHNYNESYRRIAWSVEASDEELLIVHALGVHPAFSGRGIAKEMVRRVLALAKEGGIKTVRLDVLCGNLPAEKAYTRMGFRYLDTIRMYYEDTGWTDFKAFEYLL